MTFSHNMHTPIIRGSRGGMGVYLTLPYLENHKDIGSFSSIGPVSLENHRTARFLEVFGSSRPSSTKTKTCQIFLTFRMPIPYWRKRGKLKMYLFTNFIQILKVHIISKLCKTCSATAFGDVLSGSALFVVAS